MKGRCAYRLCLAAVHVCEKHTWFYLFLALTFEVVIRLCSQVQYAYGDMLLDSTMLNNIPFNLE